MTRLIIACFCTLMGALPAAGFDHSHARLEAVLKKHVRDARVNYAALKSDRSGLDAYLRDCGTVREADFKQWTQPQQLAFLINLYNAATLELVIDHYPVRSIKNIGGIFKGPWEQEVVHLFGSTTTLDAIEHGMLRRDYEEPRIHFAIVCAAKSCPSLRAEAYVAPRLDGQLEEQGRIFLQARQSNRLDRPKRTVYLSPIFKWFSSDFERGGQSVLAFVTPYFATADREALAASRDWKLRYTDYDWSLNDAARK